MDIAALSTALSQMQVQQQASLSVMKMTMDTGATQANDLLQMMQASTDAVDPNVGKTIDIKL
ncbi:YjfB family protein [Ralstonia pickettii]|nr:YjfB family protein [Ralstonia pickettii]